MNSMVTRHDRHGRLSREFPKIGLSFIKKNENSLVACACDAQSFLLIFFSSSDGEMGGLRWRSGKSARRERIDARMRMGDGGIRLGDRRLGKFE